MRDRRVRLVAGKETTLDLNVRLCASHVVRHSHAHNYYAAELRVIPPPPDKYCVVIEHHDAVAVRNDYLVRLRLLERPHAVLTQHGSNRRHTRVHYRRHRSRLRRGRAKRVCCIRFDLQFATVHSAGVGNCVFCIFFLTGLHNLANTPFATSIILDRSCICLQAVNLFSHYSADDRVRRRIRNRRLGCLVRVNVVWIRVVSHARCARQLIHPLRLRIRIGLLGCPQRILQLRDLCLLYLRLRLLLCLRHLPKLIVLGPADCTETDAGTEPKAKADTAVLTDTANTANTANTTDTANTANTANTTKLAELAELTCLCHVQQLLKLLDLLRRQRLAGCGRVLDGGSHIIQRVVGVEVEAEPVRQSLGLVLLFDKQLRGRVRERVVLFLLLHVAADLGLQVARQERVHLARGLLCCG